MTAPVEALRDVVARFPEVRLAYLFGSVARGEPRAGSDLDLAVLLGGEISGAREDEIRNAAESATGRPVDLVVLDRAPPLLLHEVIATGTVILCRDDAEQAEFEMRALARYLDTRRLRDTQVAYLREHVGL